MSRPTPIWLKPVLIVVLPVYLLVTVVLALLFFIFAGVPVYLSEKVLRRKWARQHAGEARLLCSAEDWRLKASDIEAHRFYEAVVESAMPKRCRMLHFGLSNGELSDEELMLIGKVSHPAFSPELEWPRLVLIRPGRLRSISVRRQFEEMRARWRSGVDVRPMVTRLLRDAIEVLESQAGAAIHK